MFSKQTIFLFIKYKKIVRISTGDGNDVITKLVYKKNPVKNVNCLYGLFTKLQEYFLRYLVCWRKVTLNHCFISELLKLITNIWVDSIVKKLNWKITLNIKCVSRWNIFSFFNTNLSVPLKQWNLLRSFCSKIG